jgi:hypothetical protein
MSQDTFPFAPVDEAPSFVDEGESSNRRAVLVAGGVAAALVVAAGGWFLLGGSSDTVNNSAFVPAKSRPAAVAPKKVVTKPVKKLPTAYKDKLGRDPFRALYVVPVAAAVTPGTTPTGTTPTGTTPTGTTPTGSTTGSTGTTSGTPTGTTRYALKLVAISKPSPEVRFFTWMVAGKKVVVIPGQRFGKVGEIVVLAYERNAAGTATGAIIQVGDDSPIDVQVGETVSVL